MARPRTSLGPTMAQQELAYKRLMLRAEAAASKPLKEADLSRTIQIALCARGHRLWRFNVGLLCTPDGRLIRVGVKGASDLIGIAWGGRFLSVEIKLPGGKPTIAQNNWLAMIKAQGGRAGIAHSIEEAIEIAEGLQGLPEKRDG